VQIIFIILCDIIILASINILELRDTRARTRTHAHMLFHTF